MPRQITLRGVHGGLLGACRGGAYTRVRAFPAGPRGRCRTRGARAGAYAGGHSPALLLLAVPVTAAGQSPAPGTSRLPLRLCAWEDGAFVRLPAYYDRASNALFASTSGSQAFALPSPASPAYARATPWYATSDTVSLGGERFASFRGAAVLDESGLTLAGTFAGVPFFRRPGGRAETVYALVGPGARADGPTPYTDGGRCEFQPYRRVAPVTEALEM